MRRAALIVAIAIFAGALILPCAGCGPKLDDVFKQELDSQGLPVKSVEVDVTPHEAQIMMDRMILQSHGITKVRDEELVHATVTLENGEEVSAVKWDGKVYTYKK